MRLISPASPLSYSRLDTAFNAARHNTLTVTMRQAMLGQCQNFSLDLLHELTSLNTLIHDQDNLWHDGTRYQPIDYLVMRSAHPSYYSLGGDLAYFRECIRQRNRSDLRAYSLHCADMVYAMNNRPDSDTTTIALIQGRALGGGFESALTADFIIAEEHSEFGFPEILFGLFPCTGGMSLLTHRIGANAAERMMTDGKIYTAKELHARGIVHELCASGDGNAAVERFIDAHAKQGTARQLLQRSRRRLCALDRNELHTVVEEWTDAALGLSDAHLRVMDMLIRMQHATLGS